MSLRFLLLLIPLLAASMAPAASAAADPNPAVDQWVEAQFELTFSSVTAILLEGTLDVRQYTDDGFEYSAKDIRDAYAGANRHGSKTGQAFITSLERDIAAQVAQVLADAFPRAESRVVTLTDVDESTLAPSADAFDPPVRVRIGAEIQRSANALGLGGYTQQAVDALFASGAAVETTFSLSTQAGYVTHYVMHAPPGLVFASPSEGQLAAGGRTFTLTRDNTLGASTIQVPVEILLRDAEARAPAAEDVDTTVDVAMGELREGMTEMPIDIHVEMALRAVDVAAAMPGALPETVRADYMSADAIRALRAAGALRDEDLARADEVLLSSLRTRLAGFLDPATMTLTGALSRADLAGGASRPYDGEPAIGFTATASGAYLLDGASTQNLDIALDIGALIRFDLDLFASERGDTTFVLHAPEGVVFAAAEGTLTDEGRTITYTVPAATLEAPPFRASLGLRDPNVPAAVARAVGPGAVQLQEDATLAVTLDIRDLDISLGKAVGGDMGNLLVDVTVAGDLAVFEIPADLKAQLGDSLDLDYLSSDAVRILLREGIITEADIDLLEQSLLQQVRQNLASALGGEVTVQGGLDRATLLPSLIGATPDGSNPLVFRATSSLVRPLQGSPAPHAAIALYTQVQSFRLPQVEGLDTAYTVILPKGLAVTGMQADNAEYETGKSPDGRDQFTVRPTDGDATATVSMSVTPSFVMAKFWPVVLVVGLVLVLLVGSPIALVVLRRRKKA